MALFSTARQRRLWLWTLAVVVAIYSTLGLAQTLAGELLEQALLVPPFLFAISLLVATVVAQGVRARLRGMEFAVVLGGMAVAAPKPAVRADRRRVSGRFPTIGR